MQLTHLTLDVRDGIAYLTIDRADKLNALNAAVIEDLGHAARHIATDTAIRGAILTGAGSKAFVAGADIGEMADQTPRKGWSGRGAGRRCCGASRPAGSRSSRR